MLLYNREEKCNIYSQSNFKSNMTKDRKVSMIISSSINGGAQVLLANLAEEIKGMADLIVICPAGFLVDKLRAIGVKVIEEDVNFFTMGSIRKKILEWSGGEECTVNPFLFGTSFLCAWTFRNDKNCHVFSWLHNPIIREDLSWIKQKAYIYIAKLIGRFSDVIGVGSPELKNDVQSLTGKVPIYLENRVPNKVLPKNNFYDGERPLKVCFVGRMAEEKRPDLFVRTAKRVHDEGASVRFYMAGEGPLKENIVHYLNNNNLSGTVKLMGFIKDIYSFLGEMDVLMITSEYENTPLAVLEAMNASLVVVAGNVVGIPHLILDGVDGVVTKEYSENGFAREILALYDNPQLVENLGRKCYEKSITEFSFNKFVDTYMNAII